MPSDAWAWIFDVFTGKVMAVVRLHPAFEDDKLVKKLSTYSAAYEESV